MKWHRNVDKFEFISYFDQFKGAGIFLHYIIKNLFICWVGIDHHRYMMDIDPTKGFH